jgi:predicted transcriptional regulator
MVIVSSAISVRLDDEALRALAQLEATGLSRSEAIRRAILDSATRLQRRAALAAEVTALEADEDDRREMLQVAAVMESMRAAG